MTKQTGPATCRPASKPHGPARPPYSLRPEHSEVSPINGARCIRASLSFSPVSSASTLVSRSISSVCCLQVAGLLPIQRKSNFSLPTLLTHIPFPLLPSGKVRVYVARSKMSSREHWRRTPSLTNFPPKLWGLCTRSLFLAARHREPNVWRDAKDPI